MKSFKSGSKMFAVALIFAMAFTAVGSTTTIASQSHALPAHQERAVIGGDACQFGAGFSVGLGVAGLFGCVVCAAGSLAIDVAEVIWC
ncbi:MAG TPA: hypothetical protein VG323_07170 [Thermoanaerobaculia bacterium]|nr:hypothetical protein [Thermoanaerobaculia bacterium]